MLLYLEMGRISMTQLEVAYRYGADPDETAMRAVDNMREVYGVRRVRFDQKERVVRVEFDASRLKDPVIAGLLRRAGIDVREKLALAALRRNPGGGQRSYDGEDCKKARGAQENLWPKSFSRAPRCAPLRLSCSKASRMPIPND
jgi:hypothetical protein